MGWVCWKDTGYIHEAISPTGVTGDVRLAETLKLDNIITVAKAVETIDKKPVGIFSVDLMGEKVSEINPRLQVALDFIHYLVQIFQHILLI